MNKILKTFISLVILGGLIYHFRADISRILSLMSPCVEPISYTLGAFDTRFNISKSYFLSALAEAEAIWEKPKEASMNKNLFTYESTNSDSGVLKINLIYDYRQQATSKLASLGIVVKDNRVSYDMLKAKFITLKIEYEKDKNILNARVTEFNHRQQEYEVEVNSWNKKGGAPQQEYDRLQATRLALQNEAKGLEASQENLNEKTDEINALVVVLNRLITTLNLSVEKYNTTNLSRGESFEEGVYSSDGSNREIDIYEFSNRQKLVRVLAHELGHALGLDHIEDPKAIMYRLNQGSTETLTKADLDALKIQCEVK